ncbi:MAG TPA: outer membrane beta-barrel protein [Saprospiraceae bacterium]|nr:outer membrane beta-barrel protein [Saprospiraceae bacterium]
MAEKNFFDLLKEKMAALRPTEKHRDDDWAALGDRLNLALPEQPRKWRRVLALPLLLLTALLSSNAVWWQTHRQDRAILQRLEARVTGLQSSVEVLKADTPVVRTDTVWRTVHVREIGNMGFMPSGSQHFTTQQVQLTQNELHPVMNAVLPLSKTEWDSSATVTTGIATHTKSKLPALDSAARMADSSLLETRELALLKLSNPTISPIVNSVAQPMEEDKPIKPVGQKMLDALRPKYFKVGASFGWLYAKSPGLMHEGGFSYGAEGIIGLSRHWSLTAEYNAGQVHYKAHDPAAILGAPALPPPDYGHHLTEMDVTGQKVRQFDLGLRYTFSKPGKPRPFLGLGWGGLTVLPYEVEYETQHEPTGTIQKDTFMVSERTHFQNILRFGAGLEIPLSPRFDLTLEGFYLRQWEKPSSIAPDLMGIRGGVNWLF